MTMCGFQSWTTKAWALHEEVDFSMMPPSSKRLISICKNSQSLGLMKCTLIEMGWTSLLRPVEKISGGLTFITGNTAHIKDILGRSPPVFSSTTSCHAKMSMPMITSDTRSLTTVSSTLHMLLFNQMLVVVSP